MEKWIVFKDKETGQELAAYTIRGTFSGEMTATIEMLAYENGIPKDRIQIIEEERS